MSDMKSAGWSSIRRQVDDWPRPALVALLKDLYEASAGNRDFIHARFQAEDDTGEILEKYRRKIVEQFFPARGFGKLKLADARKAIRDYRKATGNLAGTIDLLLTYVENGTEFTRNFGDVNASYYQSLSSALNEMTTLLQNDGAEFYPQFRDRLQRLALHAGHIGWGYGDELEDRLNLLEAELAERND